MITHQLKPHCGLAPIQMVSGKGSQWQTYFMCPRCKSKTRPYRNVEDAIKAWGDVNAPDGRQVGPLHPSDMLHIGTKQDSLGVRLGIGAGLVLGALLAYYLTL